MYWLIYLITLICWRMQEISEKLEPSHKKEHEKKFGPFFKI
jgi:hypothetical protein